MNHAEWVKAPIGHLDGPAWAMEEAIEELDAMQSALDDADAKLAARDDEVERAHNAGFVEASRIHRVEIERLRKDAERYRWLRCPKQDVSLVLDKRTGYVPISDDGLAGGYWIYEYRAGDELDAAIDAALSEEVKGGAL